MQTIGMIFATQLVPKLHRHEALQILFTLREVSNKDPIIVSAADLLTGEDALDDDELATAVVKAMAALCGGVMEQHRAEVSELTSQLLELKAKRFPDPSPIQEPKVWTSDNTGPAYPLLGRSALGPPK